MFILNNEQFKEFDLRKVKQFIEFWDDKYPKEKLNDYYKELNLGNMLTEGNIKQLLYWKSRRNFSEERVSGEKNKTVMEVLKNLENINAFRFNKMNGKNFKEKMERIKGIGKYIFLFFLFHVARPFEYPIADKYVFRAFSTQKQTDISQDWKGYMQYKDYFFKIAISTRFITEIPKGNEKNIKDIVHNLKRVDNALFAFGQFLDTYNK